MEKSPSFKALYARAAVPGRDYDRNAPMCQDDCEYFSGTGAYSDLACICSYAPYRCPQHGVLENTPDAGKKWEAMQRNG